MRIHARVDRSELDKLEKELKVYGVRARKELHGAVQRTTRAVARGAKARIRDKTGTLKKRIRTKMERDAPVGWVESKGPHSHLIEYGTKRHSLGKGVKRINGQIVQGDVSHPGSRPYPFMRPAFEQEAPKLIKEAKEILKK